MNDRDASSWFSWLAAAFLSLAVHGAAFAAVFYFEPDRKPKPGVTAFELVDVSFGADLKTGAAASVLAPSNRGDVVAAVQARDAAKPVDASPSQRVRPKSVAGAQPERRRVEKPLVAPPPPEPERRTAAKADAAHATQNRPAPAQAVKPRASSSAVTAERPLPAEPVPVEQTQPLHAEPTQPAPTLARPPIAVRPAEPAPVAASQEFVVAAAPATPRPVAPRTPQKTAPQRKATPRIASLQSVAVPPQTVAIAAPPSDPALQKPVAPRAPASAPVAAPVVSAAPRIASTQAAAVQQEAVAIAAPPSDPAPQKPVSPRAPASAPAAAPVVSAAPRIASTQAAAVQQEAVAIAAPPSGPAPQKPVSPRAPARIPSAAPPVRAQAAEAARPAPPNPAVSQTAAAPIVVATRPAPVAQSAEKPESDIERPQAIAPETIVKTAPVTAAPKAARVQKLPRETALTVAALEPDDPERPVAIQPSNAAAPGFVSLEALQTFDAGDCMLILPETEDLSHNSFAAFGAAPFAAERFQRDMERRHAVDVAMALSPLAEDQCAATDFVRSLPSYPLFSMRLEMDEVVIKSGAPLKGVLHNATGHLSLILVDDEGTAHNVNQYLSVVGNDVLLSARIHAIGDPVETAQMFVAIAAPVELAVLADRSSRPASQVFDALKKELTEKNVSIDVAVAAFRVE